MSSEKSCFVIAPIGEAESETRKRSDQVLKHVIGPAVEHCGYKAVRADQIDKPGLITSQVIQHIVTDSLVVADLTERNPNVFYELAIRHALRKPLVQIIRKGDTLPFDVAGTRTIYVDHRDLDSVAEAKTNIIDQVKSLEKDPAEIETPISISLDLQLLRQSEKPEERSLADILASVADLRAILAKLEVKIGTKDQQGVLDEIQAEIRTLPSRLDDFLDSPRTAWSKRGRIHPMYVRDMISFHSEQSPAIGILVISSLFRETAPWIYELGMEVYRSARKGPSSVLRELFVDFKSAMETAIYGPFSKEILGGNKDILAIFPEIESILERSLRKFEYSSK